MFDMNMLLATNDLSILKIVFYDDCLFEIYKTSFHCLSGIWIVFVLRIPFLVLKCFIDYVS